MAKQSTEKCNRCGRKRSVSTTPAGKPRIQGEGCKSCATKFTNGKYSIYCPTCNKRYTAETQNSNCPACNLRKLKGKVEYTCETCGRKNRITAKAYKEKLQAGSKYCNYCGPSKKSKIPREQRRSFVIVPAKQGYVAEADARLRASVKHISIEQYLAETGKQLTEPIPKPKSPISWVERSV